jgi:hypothetical protein
MFWKKDTDVDEFIEIIEYLVERKEDWYNYSNYPSPLYHIKYPTLQRGWYSRLAEFKKQAKEYVRQHADVIDEDEKARLYESSLISYLNRYANQNISWKDGKNARQRFAEAKDMVYYFKKEENFS